MRTSNLFKIALLSLSSCCFVACGDDDEPLSLLNADGNQTLIDTSSNTLVLSPFSDGESFYISGGDGAYTIDNSNTTVVEMVYDGRTLTLKPLARGTAIITIQDHSGNTYMLQVEIAYPQKSYKVTDVSSDVVGANLTQLETTLLEKQILGDVFVGVGGEYAFTYMVPDSTEGEVEMIPADHSLPMKGVFQCRTKYSETGRPYEEIKVHLTSGDEIIYSAYRLPVSDKDSAVFLIEDLTERYKTDYPAIEEAYSTQTLE